MSEQIENIYDENSIDVLEGLEHVRKRPSMYIGNTGTKGLHHLMYEIIDNSIDEALAGYCTEIYASINEDGSITNKDNGRGIPTGIHSKTGLSALETVLVKLNAGGKFSGKGYKVSGGLHGVGASVVNALSEYMEAKSYREGKIHHIRFNKGQTVEPFSIIGKCDYTGTEITFKPDKEMFENTTFSYSTLANRIRELAFLNKTIKIIFEDKRHNKTQINEFHYEGGLQEFVAYLNKDKNVLHTEIPYLEKTIEKYVIEFSLQYSEDYSENTYSFANNINTIDGGTHLVGFKNGLLKSFNNYATVNNLISNKFQYEDIKEGLTAIISVKLEEPEFEGQTKVRLGTSAIKKVVEDVVFEYFEVFFKENSEIAKFLMDRAILTQTFRESTKKNKDLLKAKEKLNKEVPPSKLADCSSKIFEEREVHIVEGDSAGGSAKQGRNRKLQAILPIRGKILNVEKQRLENVLSSEAIRDMVGSFGTGMGEDFNIKGLKYNLICLLVDADVDGAHIRTLLLTLIYRYMKPLITEGHIYFDCPPLYKNVIGKEIHYTYTEDEQKKFLLKNKKVSEIQRYKGIGEMNPDQLWETTLNPETRILKRVTIDDAMECDKVFSMLMGDKVEPRKNFIKEKSGKRGMNND